MEQLLIYNEEWAFCHIPKNGGANFKIRYHEQHASHTHKNAVDWGIEEEHRSLFSHQIPSWFENHREFPSPHTWIAIVRNPYDRMVSWYHFIQQKQKKLEGVSFEQYIQYFHTAVKNPKIIEFKAMGGTWDVTDNQCHWTKDPLTLYDNIITFRIEDQLNDMEEYTDTKFSDTCHNKTTHFPWASYYTDECREIVYKAYEQDFIEYGYEV